MGSDSITKPNPQSRRADSNCGPLHCELSSGVSAGFGWWCGLAVVAGIGGFEIRLDSGGVLSLRHQVMFDAARVDTRATLFFAKASAR